MSDSNEMSSGGSVKANSVGLAAVTVIGALLVYCNDYAAEKYEIPIELSESIRLAIPALSLGIYLGCVWVWTAIKPDKAEVIRDRRGIKKQIKECDKLLRKSDISEEHRAVVQARKEQYNIALIDSHAIETV